MTDDILHNLLPGEPPPRDKLDEWRERRRKFVEERSAEYRARHPEEAPRVLDPMTAAMMRGIAKAVGKEIAAAKAELRSEIEVLREHMRRTVEMAQRPRRRNKKMTRAEMDAFVMSNPRAPR
jgi:hypothetical protein